MDEYSVLSAVAAGKIGLATASRLLKHPSVRFTLDRLFRLGLDLPKGAAAIERVALDLNSDSTYMALHPHRF